MKKALFFSVVVFFACFLVRAHAQETLSWDDCVVEAQKNNPDLIVAVEGIKQQKAGKAITASALFPQVTSGVDASTGKSGGATSDSYSYGVSGSQLIFDGLKTINEVKSASESIKASQQNYRFTSSEVRLTLRAAFINLLRAQALIDVTEEIVKIRRSNVELIALRYASGLEHKGALLTAEANLAEAAYSLSQAKRDVTLAQRQLTKAMGRAEFVPMLARGDFTVRDTAADKPSFEELVKDNPSVLEAVAQKNAAAFNVKSTYGNFFPQITASAGAGKSGTHWPPEDNQSSAGVSLSLPLFEGGLRLAQVAQAKSLLNQAIESERSIRDAALVNLEQTWATLQNALDAVGVARKSLDASAERAKIAEAQYSTGFITFDNWTIIQDDLVRAKRAYLAAQVESLLAEAQWKQAKGETLEYVN